MLKKISLVVALILVGCSHSAAVQTIHTPVAPVSQQETKPTEDASTPPPVPTPPPVDTSNWIQFKGKVPNIPVHRNWSLSVPASFKDISKTLTKEQNIGLNTIVLLESEEAEIRTIFVATPTKDDLMTYTAKLANGFKTNGSEILTARQSLPGKGMGGFDGTLLIIVLNERVIAWHFIAISDGVAYNLECGTPMMSALKNKSICMEISESVKITH